MAHREADIPPNTLVINEIFHSIQGESSHMGRPCTFVRLTWCNIRCSYCDTPYAFEEGKELHIDSVMAEVRRIACRLVEITGGEPLFQSNVKELIIRLCDEGFEVLVETGGMLDIGVVDTRAVRIVDFKCPSSGMEKKNLWSNVGHLTLRDEVKFVIGDREDYEWSKQRMAQYRLENRAKVLMSPVFGVLEPSQLAAWILEDRLNVRYQLQMHKYIWTPEARGV